jgi:hypothetical protein
MSRGFRGACLAWLLLCLVACGETANDLGPPGSPAPSATRTPGSAPYDAGVFTPAPGTIFFGAYVDPSGLAHGFDPGDVANFEAQIGRTLTLHQEYLSFTADFTGNLMTDDFVHYRVPIVSWNCQFTDEEIASGAEDSTIMQAAESARSFSGPMFIRYMWDPNLPATEFSRSSCWNRGQGDYPGNVFSPSLYVAAWQRIYQIFQTAGAKNVIWLWTVSADPGAASPGPYYPGNTYVDWVGMDAYDLNSGSVASTYSSMYSTLASYNQPIMISETGAASAIQPAFFSSVASTLQQQFPLVKGWVYYDALNYNGADTADWRIVTSAWPSFITLANSSYLSGTYVP